MNIPESIASLCNRHALECENLRQKCERIGAPDFMYDLFILMSEKTAFDLRSGTALLQPFISGNMSPEDAINISESTGWLLNAASITSLSSYENELVLLHNKLK
ncbi:MULTISPECIES: hypothetical protein [Enterobacteriaceae]|uniref:hypothetical protein n=1 Tax=Enterobacteriaceae TaxID=543 RepID=UPI000F87161A|nr:hypothetical protein [Enterobacter asburiae]RTP92112.1 hypothetical protein EKN35_12930 [Enterobacter asburiae]